jgi:hypothetical protein
LERFFQQEVFGLQRYILDQYGGVKVKEKPMTRAEIRKLVRAEVVKFMKGFAETAAEQKATKLENAIGFKWTPPEAEIYEKDPFMEGIKL